MFPGVSVAHPAPPALRRDARVKLEIATGCAKCGARRAHLALLSADCAYERLTGRCAPRAASRNLVRALRRRVLAGLCRPPERLRGLGALGAAHLARVHHSRGADRARRCRTFSAALVTPRAGRACKRPLRVGLRPSLSTVPAGPLMRSDQLLPSRRYPKLWLR